MLNNAPVSGFPLLYEETISKVGETGCTVRTSVNSETGRSRVHSSKEAHCASVFILFANLIVVCSLLCTFSKIMLGYKIGSFYMSD